MSGNDDGADEAHLGAPSGSLSITTSSLSAGTIGVTYSETLKATGGTTPYTWSVSTGALPVGLSMSSGGVLSGAPSPATTATFTVQVKDAESKIATRAFTLTVAASPVSIYVVFPPQSGSNNTHFTGSVLRQDAIAGVTDSVIWNTVETSSPTAGKCVGGDSDVQQTDAVSYCHRYDWSTADNKLAQWFSTTSGWGTKKVNVLLFGIGNSPTNDSTPHYVTTQSWIAATGAKGVDLINDEKDGCGGYTGPSLPGSMTGSGKTVTVNWTGHGLATGDVIWVEGASPSAFNISEQSGVAVTVQSSDVFTYTASSTVSGTASGTIHIVSAAQSWPLPSQAPYQTAFEAFVAAAIDHYNHSKNLSQLGYMRPGFARGGEAILLCPQQLVDNGVYSSVAEAKTQWLAYYGNLSGFIQLQKPQFQVMTALNAGGNGGNDYDYGTQEGLLAVTYQNALGKPFGFGSQGLEYADIANYSIPPPPYCSSAWCNAFDTDAKDGPDAPRELQQIDCSDPTMSVEASEMSCIQGNGKSKTGDLRTLLPFAADKGLQILELYAVDAALAFDPNFCVQSGGKCGSGSWSGAVYATRVAAQPSSGGDGSYAATLNAISQ